MVGRAGVNAGQEHHKVQPVARDHRQRGDLIDAQRGRDRRGLRLNELAAADDFDLLLERAHFQGHLDRARRAAQELHLGQHCRLESRQRRRHGVDARIDRGDIEGSRGVGDRCGHDPRAVVLDFNGGARDAAARGIDNQRRRARSSCSPVRTRSTRTARRSRENRAARDIPVGAYLPPAGRKNALRNIPCSIAAEHSKGGRHPLLWGQKRRLWREGGDVLPVEGADDADEFPRGFGHVALVPVDHQRAPGHGQLAAGAGESACPFSALRGR